MDNNNPEQLPIVVGVDGSKHAVRATLWGVDEAVDRDVLLLLTYVINAHAEDLDHEFAVAHHALHAAWVAAEATGEPVKLVSTVLQGEPVELLCTRSPQTTPDVMRISWNT